MMESGTRNGDLKNMENVSNSQCEDFNKNHYLIKDTRESEGSIDVISWYDVNSASHVPWPSRAGAHYPGKGRIPGSGDEVEHEKQRKSGGARGWLEQKYILILSSHRVSVHFCHFHDSLEAMKFCLFFPIIRNLISMHYWWDPRRLASVLLCQLHVCLLRRDLS